METVRESEIVTNAGLAVAINNMIDNMNQTEAKVLQMIDSNRNRHDYNVDVEKYNGDLKKKGA